jgi:hypothetical protein
MIVLAMKCPPGGILAKPGASGNALRRDALMGRSTARIAVPDAKLAVPGPFNPPTPMQRLQRFIASPTSGALAYTAFCLVTLLYAVCVAKMPLLVLERVEQVRDMLG